jgi:cbb3-type cytochrome oxidase maturation protein
MSVLYIVLPLALIVVGVAIAAFLWAARRGQFDDLETPAVRALHDDAPAKSRESKSGLKPRGAETDETTSTDETT